MPIFTVQQHAATTLHFDFRLEVDGVLRSWAVPKGPSLDPSVKRLAVQVPDHALDYADFEGRHGPGYGEGAVIVWDMGDYEPLTDGDFGQALDQGHASFELHGHKLRGGFTLQRTRGGKKPQWLLIKKRDEHAVEGDSLPPESVLSGRKIEDL
jgi:DNA ligase D-like protein (predicted 3'-phosphoesterase)